MPRETAIHATFHYVAPMQNEPEYYLYDPGPDTVKHEPVQDPRSMPVQDIRGHEADYSLDEHGFALTRIDFGMEAFSDPDSVRAHYYPAVAGHVQQITGAAEVRVFDHNFRSHKVTARNGSDDQPVMWVHNDYTELSAPQRIRELYPEDADRLLSGRYVFINLWRPVTRTVQESPLGVCSARSVQPDDFVTLALRYRDRDGQIYFMRHNPDHQWFYCSGMQTDEALLLKCFDSARDGKARYTAHSAFVDPTSPADAPLRESLEARTIAFFA